MAICPFMSDHEHRVDCTKKCALCLRNDSGGGVCGILVMFDDVQDIKEKIAPDEK